MSLEVMSLEALLPRPELRAAWLAVQAAPDLRGACDAVAARFPSDRQTAALLAGVCATGRGRAILDMALESAFRRDRRVLLASTRETAEVVVGSGPHAAIYCSQRPVPPLVLEARGRAGGVFAVARRPVFFLNSRNRPGSVPSAPGSGGALNALPGCALQPSDLGGAEYQTQDVLATAVRANLALSARVACGQRVESVRAAGRGVLRVSVADAAAGRYDVLTPRVVLCSGAGSEREREASPAVMTFEGLLAHAGDPHVRAPLAGFERVAVVGAGDSGSVAVEWLMGMGPDPGGPASLDFVERLDWFGQSCVTREQFEAGARSRYAGIGRHMRRFRGEPQRVVARPARIASWRSAGGGVQLLERGSGRVFPARVFPDALGSYDHAVFATGLKSDPRSLLDPELRAAGEDPVLVEGVPVALKVCGHAVFRVGPAARIPVSATEARLSPATARIPQNSAALFRYAERTQRLAQALPDLEAGPPPRLEWVPATPPGRPVRIVYPGAPFVEPVDELTDDDVLRAVAALTLGRVSMPVPEVTVVLVVSAGGTTWRASGPVPERPLGRMLRDPFVLGALRRGAPRGGSLRLDSAAGALSLPSLHLTPSLEGAQNEPF